jgi:hypothetical protein
MMYPGFGNTSERLPGTFKVKCKKAGRISGSAKIPNNNLTPEFGFSPAAFSPPRADHPGR